MSSYGRPMLQEYIHNNIRSKCYYYNWDQNEEGSGEMPNAMPINRTVYVHQSTKCKEHSLCTPTRFLHYLVWTQPLVHTDSSLYGNFTLVWTFPLPFTPSVLSPCCLHRYTHSMGLLCMDTYPSFFVWTHTLPYSMLYGHSL